MARRTNEVRWIRIGVVVVVIVLGLWLVGGSFSRRDPVPELVRQLAQHPEYSIIVDDVDDGFLRKLHDAQEQLPGHRADR